MRMVGKVVLCYVVLCWVGAMVEFLPGLCLSGCVGVSFLYLYSEHRLSTEFVASGHPPWTRVLGLECGFTVI